MAEDILRYEIRDDVALLQMDDGKANALSPDMIRGVHAALDRAEKEAAAVAWLGRPGRFSGGFDLATMRAGPEAVRGLVSAGAELFVRIYRHPAPVVVGCTGHAIAAGALALLAADWRVGTRGAFQIGLNEVAIGMTLPLFGVEMARHRLSKRHLVRATTQAELYAPDAALDAGYLDAVVDPDALAEETWAAAQRLAGLRQPALAGTKERVHGDVCRRIEASLESDMRSLTGG
jgi:enoyl-CoA hydratase